MGRVMQSRVAAAVRSLWLILPTVWVVGAHATAFESTQHAAAPAQIGAAASEPGEARLIVRVREGVDLKIVAGLAEVVGPADEAGARSRGVVGGYAAGSVRPVFDMSSIGDPELARAIGLEIGRAHV